MKLTQEEIQTIKSLLKSKDDNDVNLAGLAIRTKMLNLNQEEMDLFFEFLGMACKRFIQENPRISNIHLWLNGNMDWNTTFCQPIPEWSTSEIIENK